MTELLDARLTLPEASFVAGLSVQEINREIDAKIIRAGRAGDRKVRGADLFYLSAISGVRAQMGPALRKNLHRSIVAAATALEPEAHVSNLVFRLDGIRERLAHSFRSLEHSKTHMIESLPDVMGGEPVILGTRIPARHIADILRNGGTREELREELDLNDEQIEAALIFDQTTPRRGRPALAVDRTIHVPADR
jgi:uncharacterized protein (DUF433 family)